MYSAACIGSALLLSLFVTTADAQQAPELEFRWGGDAEGGAPFVEADPRDPTRVVGFDVEVAELLARGLGRMPRFIQAGFTSLDASAARGDFDLTQHQKFSGKAMDYFDEEAKAKYVPHVIEPSAGVDRTVLALICEAYDEESVTDDKGKSETRIVLRFHPQGIIGEDSLITRGASSVFARAKGRP